jgi:N-acetylglucosamine malate deacetylase 2
MGSALATTATLADPTGWLPASTAPANRQLPDDAPAVLAANGLPRARTVLAVTARPGPESAELGALLYAFGQAGACLALLSLTRGEASPVNSTRSRLETVRPWELQLASWLLGISSVAVADYPDGGLRYCEMAQLTERVQRAIGEYAPDLILVLDPATGDSQDAQVARAVFLAAKEAGVRVVARTSPGARHGWPIDLGPITETARAVQRSALRAHASQAEALPEELHSLDSLSGCEQLCWLIPAAVEATRVIAPRASVQDRQTTFGAGLMARAPAAANCSPAQPE